MQEILIEGGFVSPDQLSDLLSMRKDATEEVDDLLLRLGYLSEKDRMVCRAQQTGIPFIDLNDQDLDFATARKLPQGTATRCMAVALEITDYAASVAMMNPLDLNAIDEIAQALGVEVDPFWASLEQIRSALVRVYGNVDDLANLIGEYRGLDSDTVHLEQAEEDDEAAHIMDVRGEGDSAPAIKLANALIARAVKIGASDIHIEPAEKLVRVRLRVDGLLQEIMQVPKDIHRALCSRLKVIAGLDIAERRIPQDGRITMYMQEGSFDLRVATYPSAYGEKIIIRVLNKNAISMKLSDLGFPKEALETLIEIAEMPQGLILVNGPTGSGKTTTLYSILNHLNEVHRHIITIEDPVEYRLDGIIQGNVNTAAGLTFARGLRAMLRADPDVILVGESRDPETAGTAIEAALTGHLVLTSIHSNDAAGAIIRLVEMGIEPFLVGSSVTCSVAQRLVRKICPKCKDSYKPEKNILDKLGLPHDHDYVKGHGCEFCSDSGYKGRLGIYEVMKITPSIRKLIYSKAPGSEVAEASRAEGMKGLRDDAVAKVLSGLTSVDEVLRVSPEEQN
jgi:type IV pilus assembly protein PilB